MAGPGNETTVRGHIGREVLAQLYLAEGDEHDKARARLARIADRHMGNDLGVCPTCLKLWPCPDYRDATGAES